MTDDIYLLVTKVNELLNINITPRYHAFHLLLVIKQGLARSIIIL